MPDGKPDPECKDCKGTGQIILLTSSSKCDCIKQVDNSKIKRSLKPFDGPIYADPKLFEDFEEELPVEIPLKFKPLNLKPLKSKLLDGLIEKFKKLQLSADYIADGITTWHTWPGIEGHTCNGCGAEMNVLGMSYNHWCPLCDPDGKENVFHNISHDERMPFDYPVFGPSIDTIHEGIRKAKTTGSR